MQIAKYLDHVTMHDVTFSMILYFRNIFDKKEVFGNVFWSNRKSQKCLKMFLLKKIYYIIIFIYKNKEKYHYAYMKWNIRLT